METMLQQFRTTEPIDRARLIAIAILQKDAIALAYMLGQADNADLLSVAEMGAVVEAALVELGCFPPEA